MNIFNNTREPIHIKFKILIVAICKKKVALELYCKNKYLLRIIKVASRTRAKKGANLGSKIGWIYFWKTPFFNQR